jgi:hypothetical protein
VAQLPTSFFKYWVLTSILMKKGTSTAQMLVRIQTLAAARKRRQHVG